MDSIKVNNDNYLLIIYRCDNAELHKTDFYAFYIDINDFMFHNKTEDIKKAISNYVGKLHDQYSMGNRIYADSKYITNMYTPVTEIVADNIHNEVMKSSVIRTYTINLLQFTNILSMDDFNNYYDFKIFDTYYLKDFKVIFNKENAFISDKYKHFSFN